LACLWKGTILLTTLAARHFLPLLSGVALAATLLTGCAQHEDTAATSPSPAASAGAAAETTGKAITGTFKVGLVVPDPITDGGWAQSANDGLKAIAKDTGAEIGQPVENDSAAAFEGIFRNFASQGDQLVFAHGTEYEAAAKKVAADTPGTIFSVMNGREVGPNLMPVQFDAGQGTYLAGMLAAGMSKTGKIGCIGPQEIPIIKETFDAFEKGAKAVNPNIEVKRAFIGSTDVAKGKLLAQSFLSAGIDVIVHNADDAGKGVAQAVMEKDGAMFIGANSDQSDLATPKNLGSFILDVPHAMDALAHNVKDGKDLGKAYKGGLKDGAVGLVYNAKFAGTIPADLKAKIDAAKADMIAGKLTVD
jgi:basic membrane lipoprotein Med (substrate-binding protein (PBP1-ABC) superfamily)